MQKLPLGKFVAGLVFAWGVIVLLHCVATRYAGLVVLRIALGAAESVVVPAMEMTIGMFFPRKEHSFLQPVLWITSATAPVVAAFISYGLLWSKSSVLPWKLFMIVTEGGGGWVVGSPLDLGFATRTTPVRPGSSPSRRRYMPFGVGRNQVKVLSSRSNSRRLNSFRP